MLGSKQKSGKFSWPWNKAIEQSLFESELHTRIRARTQFDREYREKYPYISNAELDLRWENGEGEEILASIIRQPPKTTSSSFSAGLAKKFFYAAMVVAAIGVVSAIAIPVFKNGFAAWEQSREESRKAEAHQELEAKKKQDELDAKYQAAIDAADDAFDKKDYAAAKPKYVEATGLKPTEKYPKDRIAEVDGLMAEAARPAVNDHGDLILK